MHFLRFFRQNAPFLAAGMLLSFGSCAGQTFFIAIFAGEIRGELGLGHGQWGAIYAIGTMASALVMVWVGALTDMYRVRHITLFVIPALALACLAMAAVPGAIALTLVIFALRLAGQGMMSQLAVTSMARWFVANRGRALSISFLGFALGQAALPLIVASLLEHYSWRSLWVATAGVTLLLLPILARLLRAERTPKSVASASEATGMNGRHWTRRAVLGNELFWLSLPMLIGAPAWGTALFFQQVHLAEVKGWPLVEFVALFPLLTVVAVATSLVSGTLIDRFGALRVALVYLLPWFFAFLVLSYAQSLFAAAIGMALMGVANGMQTAVPTALFSEAYGTRHIGAIKALVTAVMVLGSAIGPGITGVLIDHGLNFPQQMLGICAYFLISGVLLIVGVLRAMPTLSAAPKVDVIGA